jgi:hypothetical protein
MQAILSATARTRCGEPASGYAQTGLGVSDLGNRFESVRTKERSGVSKGRKNQLAASKRILSALRRV